MRKIIFLSVALLALMDCVTVMGDPTLCSEPTHNRHANIHYGDSEIRVEPAVFKVKKGNYLRFKLHPSAARGPHNQDYEGVTVTIKSKFQDKNTWINSSGTGRRQNGMNRVLKVCVPPTQPDGEVSYLVKVDTVGELDPRADVTPP